MVQIFNKLVRDNIPNIIENNGEKAITRILSDKEYRVELYKKLLEESQEVINSQDTEDILEELADVLEVLKSIAELENRNLDDVIEIANQKRLKRGGFSKKIFLEKTNKWKAVDINVSEEKSFTSAVINCLSCIYTVHRLNLYKMGLFSKWVLQVLVKK